MRFLIAILVNLALWSAAHAADQDVTQLVDAAIKALQTKSYEARMHYYGTTANSGEQVVYIYHIAPQLYHVRMMEQDAHGRLEETGLQYIENGVEQVRLFMRDNQILAVEQMPERSFFTRDALTIKFLRDLAAHPGTVVLNGMVGEQPVYVLRQTKHPEKPYTITVGLDKENDYFPLFLLVTDSNEAQQIYYEVKVIKFTATVDMNPELFRIPEMSRDKNFNQIGANQLSPDTVIIQQDVEGNQAKLSVRRPSAAEDETSSQGYGLPLYPMWLPEGYTVEGLRLLRYRTTVDGEKQEKLVYQFEILSPANSSALSIFQAETGELDFSAESIDTVPECGYVIQERDNWLITVMGILPNQTLLEIVRGLEASDVKVGELLELTRDRDLVQRQVVETDD